MTAESEPRTERDDDDSLVSSRSLYAPKSEVDIVASWAEHFQVGDTIRWTVEPVDGVQDSEIIGFSTRTNLAKPVIEPPEDLYGEDPGVDSTVVDKSSWVPDETESVAEIEMEYTQRMTVKIPVDEMPADESDAFHLVKNTDPEFVADALPNRWDDAVAVGELDVVDIEEEEVGKR